MRLVALLSAIALSASACISVDDPIEQRRASVIEIFVGEGSFCSAVVLSETRIATAKHCTAHNVRVPGMKVISVTESARHDVAVIEVASTLGTPRAEIAPYFPEHGDRLVLVGVGCEGEREHRMLNASSGIVQTSGEACGGDSGGGYFNARGELVGIHSGRYVPGRAESTDAAVLHDMM